MNLRWHLGRLLVSLLFFAVVFTYYFKPTANYTTTQTILAVLLIQFGAIIVGAILGGGGIRKLIFQTLAISALTSVFLIYFLKPAVAVSFDQTFLDIFVIEIIGLVVSRILVGRKR